MTKEEVAVMDLSSDLWNAFLALPEEHPDDKREFRLHLHALQNIVLARVGLRSLRKMISEPEVAEGGN